MFKKMIYLMSFVLVLGLVLMDSYAKASLLNDGVVAYWRFENNADDSSGSGHDATGVNGPTYVAGKVGQAIRLDAPAYPDGQYLTVAAPAMVPAPWTVSVWVNKQGPPQNYDASGLLDGGRDPDKTNPEQTTWFGIRLEQFGSGTPSKVGMTDVASSPANPYWEYALTTGEWVHLVFIGTDAGATLYADGISQGVLAETASWPVWIGQIGKTQFYNCPADAILDELAIWDRALTQEEVLELWNNGYGTALSWEAASALTPQNGATDVSREVVLSWTQGAYAAPTNGHKVYFGESFDDVNDATGGAAQTAASHAPAQRLDLGTTYYWRVDEVNALPTSHIEFKGEVWSFTTEPVAYPIEDVNATASSALLDMGPENTVNGSGLDADDLHSAEQTDMWMSSSEPNGAWIEYEFNKVYKLHEMWVWNSNQMTEPTVGFGIKEATIEYSVDGTNWAILGTTHEFAQAPGVAGYACNTVVDLSGVVAKYVKITANSNWGGFVPQYSLSEVRFFSIPVFAREPSPNSGATDVAVDVTLGFRAGREAAKHDVYLSTDEQAVIDGTALVSTVTETSYSTSLDVDSTYYWRVDEVNDAETPTTWQGNFWNLSTPEFLVVEDFEGYNDLNPDDPGSNRIFNTWIDGYDNPAVNGSIVGYADAPFAEQSIVSGGKQSMPFFYDNSVAAYSEATANIADLQVGQDWTKHGIKALTLRFSGDPNNAVQPMYVKLNGSKVTYDGDAENIRRTVWQMWYIDLASLGVSLSNVTELSIGFERSGAVGGQGVVYFDGIRLYSRDRQLITPVEPGTANLVGHWMFDEGSGTTAADSSGNNNHGTITGAEWVAGQVGGALKFNGAEYVEVPPAAWSSVEKQVTIAFWVYGDPDAQPQACSCFGAYQDPAVENSRVAHCHLPWSNGNVYFDTGGTADGYDRISKAATPAEYKGSWQHWTFTKDADTGEQSIYLNGVLWHSGSGLTRTMTGVTAFTIGSNSMGAENFNYAGLMDDFRLYDRALSEGEIAWLGGVTKPFDKPF
ncbi:MAG TPA: LamG-like jellyroll fold domain-containing protein [Sedimentisphaerales bacterium]|nr:LamG-like jellyroll fold domain-containing protein [Sedimentisphaerales bacterium]